MTSTISPSPIEGSGDEEADNTEDSDYAATSEDSCSDSSSYESDGEEESEEKSRMVADPHQVFVGTVGGVSALVASLQKVDKMSISNP